MRKPLGKLPLNKPAERYDVELATLDEAAKIMVAHTNDALQEIVDKGLDPGAGVQAVMQMSMRLYADLIGDDEEAIRQIRKFVDAWDRDVCDAPDAQIH